MCEKLMYKPQIFEEHFINSLKELVDDKVINVRVTLANVLLTHH